MKNYEKEYEKWMKTADDQTKSELSAISTEEIKERFYKHLEFGTGGLRGIIGAGINRMNKYVVARTTKGIAQYIKSKDLKDKGVVIAYDSRHLSKDFASTVADVLTSQGIRVYLFDDLRPTPELSFAIRYLNAAAGVVITASHNPSEYNGYKVYWSDGGQIPPDIAAEIYNEVNKFDMFENDIFPDSKLLNIISEEVDSAYIEAVYGQTVNYDIKKDNFSLVYTPLHGSGNIPIRKILKRAGFENVIVVDEQAKPDGDFPTVKSPNPEDKECFEIAIKIAEKNNVDLIIATDPDSDRMGIAVKNKIGEYVTMTGNQVGVLLLNYILSSEQPPQNGAVVSTIVSTKMAKKLTDYYKVKYFQTLTGFKYIGEKIHEFEVNKDYKFLFGFEESYGYLKGTYARDKDAVVASMLTAEMAAHYAEKGLTLYDVMQKLYEKFGGFYEELQSITLKGIDGTEKIKEIMKSLRGNPPVEIGGANVMEIIDYLGKTNLPKSDVLYFKLENGVDAAIRPSGTEPKIKIYYLAEGKNYQTAKDNVQKVKEDMHNIIR